MVEYAFSIMVLLYVIMGIVDLGRAFIAYNIVANTSREAARYGVISSRSSSDIVSYGASKATIGGVTVTVPTRGTAGNPSDPVVVQASYSFSPITPLISSICCSGGPLSLVSRSSMYVEQ